MMHFFFGKKCPVCHSQNFLWVKKRHNCGFRPYAALRQP
jgi:hypothetical protein